MLLKGKQYEELVEALISAFPTKGKLNYLLRIELDRNLNNIVSEGNLRNMIFELIQTAEAEGWIEDLVIGARRANSGNPKLLEVAETLGSSPLKSKTRSVVRTNKSGPVTILFLAANPKSMNHLDLDKEIKGIDDALRQTDFRDAFELEQQWAVSVEDLQKYLLRHNPDIVHFSGHGSKTGELYFVNDSGQGQGVRNDARTLDIESLETNLNPLEKSALADLFEIFKDSVKCVVLNACYSELQAHAIAQHIPCVVGMSRAIEDPSAITFAKSFYQGLGYGRDVETSFKLGKNQIDLRNLTGKDTPQILGNYDFGIDLNSW